jgi:hypothetical protein
VNCLSDLIKTALAIERTVLLLRNMFIMRAPAVCVCVLTAVFASITMLSWRTHTHTHTHILKCNNSKIIHSNTCRVDLFVCQASKARNLQSGTCLLCMWNTGIYMDKMKNILCADHIVKLDTMYTCTQWTILYGNAFFVNCYELISGFYS